MGAPVTAILGLGKEVGDAVARRFSEQGHDIIAADPDAGRLTKAQETLGDDTVLHHGDLHTRLGVRNCFTVARESYGRIDNAVIIPQIPAPDSLADFTPEHFDKSLVKAARGAALAMRIFADQIKDQEQLPGSSPERMRQAGTVTFILSSSAHTTMPGRFTESVTQSTILGIMRVGAIELAEQAIRVNAIVAVRPRAVKIDEWLPKRTPLGRAALADEIADAARYLASPDAAIITGETLKLDGGRAALSGLIL